MISLEWNTHSTLIRNIVGQPKSTIRPRSIMDTGKIAIINLAKGRIGEDNASLLGAMLMTQFQLAAMARADQEESNRRPFYLYVDEFQNLSTQSFADVLSEARKYKLSLTIAHQYIEQLPRSLRDAVFGNIGNLLVFRVGTSDASFLEEELAPYYSPSDLVNLENYRAHAKLTTRGNPTRAESISTLLPEQVATTRADSSEAIVRASRDRYGRSRGDVEERTKRWMN